MPVGPASSSHSPSPVARAKSTSPPSSVQPAPTSVQAPKKASSPDSLTKSSTTTTNGQQQQQHFDKSNLRESLDPVEYYVTQERGTERPFTNKFYKHYVKGSYSCLVCNESLFDSATKYDSGSGWPSFYDVIDGEKITTRHDSSGVGPNLLRIVANPGLIRTEVSCKKCGSHLGHVFPDGPKPTGKRYCVNSTSLSFLPSSDVTDSPSSSENDSSKAILSFPATMDGCGSDGFCTLKSREAARKKLQDMSIGAKEESVQ